MHSVLAFPRITGLEGQVISSPVKSRSVYRFLFRPSLVFSSDGVTAGCRGSVSVTLPESQIEAFFPGRLYSDSRAELFSIDTGACLRLRGSFSGDVFRAASYEAAGGGYRSAAARIRAACRLQFRRLLYAWKKPGGLLLALITGSRDFTDPELSDGFKRCGITHLLALSGMHLSLLTCAAGVFTGIAGYKIRRLVQLCTVLLFVWFAELSPSLLRSLLCFVILFLCPLPFITVLSVSFLLHLLLYPVHCAEPAFMLSYGALAGITLMADPVKRLLVRMIPGRLAGDLAASVAAQPLTAPVSVRMFRCYAPGGILASVCTAPLLLCFMYAGTVCIVCSLLIPRCADISYLILLFLYRCIESTVSFFSHIPVFSS